MAYILNIETSNEFCSVCIAKDGNVIAAIREETANNHAKVLTLHIQQLFEQANLTIADMSAIAVNKGPGSYTGLRIGLSVAKGLCYGADLPLIALSAFDIIIYDMISKNQQKKGSYLALIDARRQDAYMAIYNETMEAILPDGFLTICEQTLVDFSKFGPVFIGGDANFKIKKEWLGDFGTLVENFIYDADKMAQLSFQKFVKNETELVAYFEPYYLKNFGK